jgi:hypothetical protein
MESAHPGKFSNAQTTVLADRNARTIGPLFKSCPLCGTEDVNDGGNMQEHVVGHLRNLALRSLPSYEMDTGGLVDDLGSNQSSLADSKPPSRSTIRNYQSSEEDETIKINYQSSEEDEAGRDSDNVYSDNDSRYSDSGIDIDIVLRAQYARPNTKGLETERGPKMPGPSKIKPALFPEIPDGEDKRPLQGEITTALHGTSEDLTNDPILRNLQKQQQKLDGEWRDGYEPACAICRAPADVACYCEVKGLDVAVRQAEHRMMSSIYKDVRSWVSLRSQKFISAERERRLGSRGTPSSPFEEKLRRELHISLTGSQEMLSLQVAEKRAPEPQVQQELQLPGAVGKGREASGPPAQQVSDGIATYQAEVGESAASSTKSQSEPQLDTPVTEAPSVDVIAEYFFSLVDLTVPSDDDPEVRNPPLSALHSNIQRRGATDHSREGDRLLSV